ncbi:MAG: hypothetical protein JST92_08255 [Deltaproteobacteria bacterium]|nr:hypothetical protein [Deltaproteobacteria bacterium]
MQAHIDQLLAFSANDRDAIVAAKAEYFARTGGEVHEDDRSFEQRMQGFFNWFLFDHKGPSGLTPVQRYLQERGAQVGGLDKELLLGATQSRLSLFEFRGRTALIRRVPKGCVRVRDVFTGDDFDVVEKRPLLGIENGDLMEARLIPAGAAHHFSTSFLYHPREARAALLKEVKRRRKSVATLDPREFCWEISKMALQAERFRNVPLSAIYNFETPCLGHKRAPTPADGIRNG